jgi:SpoVK/Ycf46/Vps4 family AAA+-type ATPase
VAPSIATFEEQIRKLVAARYSIVFVETFEEERLERLLAGYCKKLFSQPVLLHTWSFTQGLRISAASLGGPEMVAPRTATTSNYLAVNLPTTVEGGLGNDTQDPLAALDAVVAHNKPALFLFRDLHRHYSNPAVARKLRDVFRELSRNYKTLFLCGPTLDIPHECQKEIAILELPLPGLQDIDRLLTEVAASFKNFTLELGEEREALVRGTLGLTELEARNAFSKLFVGKKSAGPEIIPRLYEEKREIVRKEGILEYIPPHVTIEELGGLAILKEWLRQRKRFFTKEAEEFGLAPPKGLLLTGISGCGKSQVVQAISAYWSMPMLRLDMNRIYGAVAGTPERSLELAIRTAEAISPCVLWIDEIETALVGATGGERSGLNTRIFSSFLTWMQEKQHVVFVAATANQIDKLPPELLRKGRFDEIFFVDLPSETERSDIFSVHLRKRNKDPQAFDLVSLAKATPGFNGAEIEQIVLASLYSAFDETRELTMHDLYKSLGRMVPLSTTMAERIKEIKRWADTRAVKASAA